MSYLFFPPRGAGKANANGFPFQIIAETALSGVNPASFIETCPCDTGDQGYTSSQLFKTELEYANIRFASGEVGFRIFSGSALYNQFKMPAVTGAKFSFQGSRNELTSPKDCAAVFQNPLITVFGLNKTIFIDSFFPPTAPASSTLKIWLTVCFPAGDNASKIDSVSKQFGNITNHVTCTDCTQRANVPMAAFISCGTGEWPELIKVDLISKSDDATRPRLEKRQILAHVPIGEVNKSGAVTAQYLNANLVLSDMCIQGIPVKYPISIFSEYK
jgi:hypothetical protein